MFWHLLARELHMSVWRAQREISSEEFARWKVIHEHIDPLGEYRGDLRNGILCQLIAAAHGVKDAKAADFMPFVDREQVKQSEKAKVATVKTIAAALGMIHKQKQ